MVRSCRTLLLQLEEERKKLLEAINATFGHLGQVKRKKLNRRKFYDQRFCLELCNPFFLTSLASHILHGRMPCCPEQFCALSATGVNCLRPADTKAKL